MHALSLSLMEPSEASGRRELEAVMEWTEVKGTEGERGADEKKTWWTITKPDAETGGGMN